MLSFINKVGNSWNLAATIIYVTFVSRTNNSSSMAYSIRVSLVEKQQCCCGSLFLLNKNLQEYGALHEQKESPLSFVERQETFEKIQSLCSRKRLPARAATNGASSFRARLVASSNAKATCVPSIGEHGQGILLHRSERCVPPPPSE